MARLGNYSRIAYKKPKMRLSLRVDCVMRGNHAQGNKNEGYRTRTDTDRPTDPVALWPNHSSENH